MLWVMLQPAAAGRHFICARISLASRKRLRGGHQGQQERECTNEVTERSSAGSDGSSYALCFQRPSEDLPMHWMVIGWSSDVISDDLAYVFCLHAWMKAFGEAKEHNQFGYAWMA